MNERLTSGAVLGQTFSLYGSRFGLFFGICAIVLLPLILFQFFSTLSLGRVPGTPDPQTGLPSGVAVQLAVVLLSMLLTNVATAAMVFGVFQQVRGRETTISECLSVGFRRALPVVGVSILVGLLTGIGIILCIVPGIIAMVFLAMAVPAVVIERCGVMEALSRSSDLGEGHRWTVFGVIFALTLLGGLVNVAVSGALSGVSLVALLVATSVVQIVWTGLQATGTTLLYYNLRRVKESIDADEIVRVFA